MNVLLYSSGTKQALEILREVFAPSLLQSGQGPLSAYGGEGEAATGPIAQIEVILSDCENRLRSTKTSEDEQSSDHKQFLRDTALLLKKRNADMNAAERAAYTANYNSGLKVNF